MSLGKPLLVVFDRNDKNKFNNYILENAFNSIKFLSGEEKEYIKRILQNCIDRRFKQTMYKNLDEFINDIERLIRVISNNGVDPIIMQKELKLLQLNLKMSLKTLMKVYYAIAWLWMMKLNNVKIGCLVLETAYAVI